MRPESRKYLFDVSRAAELLIIALRNVLIHGYAQVDSRILWDVLQMNLPVLQRETQILLGDG